MRRDVSKPDSTSLETCQYFFPNQTVLFPKLVSTFFKTDSTFFKRDSTFSLPEQKTEATLSGSLRFWEEEILLLVLVEFDRIENALEFLARVEARQHAADLVGAHIFRFFSAFAGCSQPERAEIAQFDDVALG
jgi:hypothetical protein